MPATQRGQAYRIGPNRWGLRYYDEHGNRRRKSPFPSKSAALAHYREILEPQLRGEPAPRPELTLSAFIALYLQRHSATVRPRTVQTLTERLTHAQTAFGAVPLRELERMSGEIAAWRARQPERVRYARMSALRQALEAAVQWGHTTRNPAKLAGSNRQPAQRAVRVFTAAEVDAITQELSRTLAPLPAFACATGLRPQEWSALERRDVDRGAGILNVRRTVSSGEVVELGKTTRSRRQVPLSPRALAALDQLPPRLDSPLVFPASGGGIINTNNFRNRVWAPAIEAAGIALPARVYDMRSTFCSNALAAGVSVFAVAQIMGTSIAMVERVYGALLDGAGRGIADRLAAFEITQDLHPVTQPITTTP